MRDVDFPIGGGSMPITATSQHKFYEAVEIEKVETRAYLITSDIPMKVKLWHRKEKAGTRRHDIAVELAHSV
jgi:hypothetical protein